MIVGALIKTGKGHECRNGLSVFFITADFAERQPKRACRVRIDLVSFQCEPGPGYLAVSFLFGFAGLVQNAAKLSRSSVDQGSQRDHRIGVTLESSGAALIELAPDRYVLEFSAGN